METSNVLFKKAVAKQNRDHPIDHRRTTDWWTENSRTYKARNGRSDQPRRLAQVNEKRTYPYELQDSNKG